MRPFTLLLGLILAVLVSCVADKARADAEARQGNDSVRLTEAPCTNAAVLALLKPEAVEHFRAASAVFNGQHFEACWRVSEGVVFLVYEDGDQGVIPVGALHQIKEV